MNRIKELRKERGLTLKDLSDELLDNVNLEISPNALGKYEQGKRKPSLETLIKLADYFGINIDYLIGRINKKEKITTWKHYFIADDLSLSTPLVTTTRKTHVRTLSKCDFEILKKILGNNGMLAGCLIDLYYERRGGPLGDVSYEFLTQVLIEQEFYVLNSDE